MEHTCSWEDAQERLNEAPQSFGLKTTFLLVPDAWRRPGFAQHCLLFAVSGGELAAGAKDYRHSFLFQFTPHSQSPPSSLEGRNCRPGHLAEVSGVK